MQEAFFELARQANVNVAIDGPLKKNPSFMYQAHEQPLGDVLENLCALSGLRYYFENNTLHICEDAPYMKTHNVQFLLGVRKTSTNTSANTDVLAEGLSKTYEVDKRGNRVNPGFVSEDGGRREGNGAQFSFKSENTVDFWTELENTLKIMLCSKKNGDKASFSLNKYAGMLSVYGTEKQQKIVACYLKHLQRLVSTQILIEAKIIEVDLMDEYKGGINWNAFFIDYKLRNTLTPMMAAQSLARQAFREGQVAANETFGVGGIAQTVPWPKAPLLDPTLRGNAIGIAGAPETFTFNVDTNYLSAIASFMEKFGTVRTLANPRLTVLNNQSAILKVARNEVFFQLQLEDTQQTLAQPFTQKAKSAIQTVPVGLIMFVHPSVNFETGEIVLSLHPMISRIVEWRSDPAVTFNIMQVPRGSEVRSEIPVIQMREMNSVVVAKENQVIVTGGLMEERVENKRTGVPYISDVPVLGQLFQHTVKEKSLTELVILLTLSIVRDGENMMDPADHRLYEQFTRDPRPL